MAGRLSRKGRVQDFVRPYQSRPLLGVVLRQQPFGGLFIERGVSVVASAVLEGEPLGLDRMVQGGGRLEAHALDVELLHDVEHLQRDQALAVGREAINIHPAIVDAMGRVPAGVMCRQVSLGHPAADPLEVTFDGLGDFALVEGPSAALGDQAIGARKSGVAEDLALARGLALGNPEFSEIIGFFDPVLGLGKDPL